MKEKGVNGMKKIIFLSFVLVFASMSWAQERVEAPVFNVGSKWITKTDNGWEMTSELIGEEKDVYILSSVATEGSRKGEWKIFYNKNNMNCVKVIRDGKDDKENMGMFKKFYDFPLYSGKKWNYQYTFGHARGYVDILVELLVTGVEDVAVPAGKFKAFKVKAKYSTTTGRDVSGTTYYWWAPDAKTRVKQEWEQGEFWRELEYAKIELISLELK